MNRLITFILLLFVFPAFASAEEYDLYFLGGQSNMEGFGLVAELPEEYQGEQEGVLIYHSPAQADQMPATGSGSWNTLRPGHGTEFRFKEGNQYSHRFGVELSLAKSLREATPDRKIAIVKYARNGSSIAIDAAANWGCWDPDFQAGDGKHRDINQYDHFLAALRGALDQVDIDGDGQADQLTPRGIVWMQGESDGAHGKEIAESYASNLKRLMDLIRAALRVDDLPVVIGRISDSGKHASGKVWRHGDVVRAQQQRFVDEDHAAVIVTTTDGYGYSDPWHYDTAGYLDLGKRFAEALIGMNE